MSRRRSTWVAGWGLLLGWILSCAGQAAGQGNSTDAGNYLVDTWSGDNGLPNSSVTAIAQTPDGYLWIGTHNGLARFNGVRFVTFDPVNTPELKHARVRALFVDRGGSLWIHTYDNSLTRWRDGHFSHEYQAQQVSELFESRNILLFAMQGGDLLARSTGTNGASSWGVLKPAGRTTGYAYAADDEGRLWYVTRNGEVGRWDQNLSGAKLVEGGAGLPGNVATHIASDASGRVWVGTVGGMAVWNGSEFENRTPTNGEQRTEVNFVFCSRDGAQWVLANERLRKSVDRQWVQEAPGWGRLLGTHRPAFAAHEDRQGGIWFRHLGQGLFHVRPDGTMNRISAADGLPGNRVTCWFEDREGTIWVGVDRGGLVRLREKRFKVLGAQQGLGGAGAVSVVENPDGTLWVGTYGGGLHRIRGDTFESFLLPDGAMRGFVFSAMPDRLGSVWLSAGREDLYVLKDDNIISAPWSMHGIKSMLLDRQGRLWIGERDGLFRIEADELEDLTSWVEGAGVHALAEGPDGAIWAGGSDGVLRRIDDSGAQHFRAEGPLGSQTIWALLADAEGDIWVGTFRGGLLRFRDGRFTRYTGDNGLPNDVICQILDDQLGSLWIGSHRGIFQVRKSALHAVAQGEVARMSCRTFGLSDGLPTLECSGSYQPSAWRGRDGRFWFATFKGVVSIDPVGIGTRAVQPPVVIEEMRVNGQKVSLARAEREVARVLRVQPGRHYYEFHFAALSYVAPDQVRFRYRLHGWEDEWVEADGRREAYYSHLKPGTYRFDVSACNEDGVWSEPGASLAFVVLPHFWQTWWFRGAAGCVVLGVLIGSVRYVATRNLRRKLESLKQQRAIERDRERIAKDIHDDLGAGLTQIMLQSAMARGDSAEDMRVHLLQISDRARELVRDMDETVWAIDPENDTLDGLVTYVGKFVQDYASAARLRCRLDLPVELPAVPLAAEVRHNVFLAVKETLNNVVKHSGATEVFCQLQVTESEFTLVLRDDGRGFTRGELTESQEGRIACGNGLRNLSDRMERIGGRCVVESEAGHGTEVRLTVMIQRRHDGTAFDHP